MAKSNLSDWQCSPGRWDTVNGWRLFPSDNSYGIPNLRPVDEQHLPRWLAPYKTRIRSRDGVGDGAVHFFLDDYRFETVWFQPGNTIKSLQQYSTLLSPDFSIHGDWPRAIQIWNVYRNRWCGAYWHELGFTVIPTVSWGLPDSYDFCFTGLPKNSLLAVSTVGTHTFGTDKAPIIEDHFRTGFEEMVERLNPTQVLCYGKPHSGMSDLATIVHYPDRWTNIRAARKTMGGGQNGW
jgi:hypothetical protein